MSERKFDYNEVSKDGLVDMAEEAELKLGKLSSRIAALEAQNKKLVEALEKIKRQDPYTTTNKSFFDFVYNTAKNALSEVTQ